MGYSNAILSNFMVHSFYSSKYIWKIQQLRNENNFSSYFDVVAGPKDISVNVEPINGYRQIPYNFGFTLPIILKANETKRFEMIKGNPSWVNGNSGNDGGSFWKSSSPSTTDWTMRITVKDTDTNGKTENKDFKWRTHKY